MSCCIWGSVFWVIVLKNLLLGRTLWDGGLEVAARPAGNSESAPSLWVIGVWQQLEDLHPWSIRFNLWYGDPCSCFISLSPDIGILDFEFKTCCCLCPSCPVTGQAYVLLSVWSICRSWTQCQSNCSKTLGSGETMVSLWLAWCFFLVPVAAALSFYFFIFFPPLVILNLDQFPGLIHFTVTHIVILAQWREQQDLAEGAETAHSSLHTRTKPPWSPLFCVNLKCPHSLSLTGVFVVVDFPHFLSTQRFFFPPHTCCFNSASAHLPSRLLSADCWST